MPSGDVRYRTFKCHQLQEKLGKNAIPSNHQLQVTYIKRTLWWVLSKFEKAGHVGPQFALHGHQDMAKAVPEKGLTKPGAAGSSSVAQRSKLLQHDEDDEDDEEKHVWPEISNMNKQQCKKPKFELQVQG